MAGPSRIIKLTNGGELWLYEAEGTGTQKLVLKAPAALGGDKTWVLPGTDMAGGFWQSDGAGNITLQPGSATLDSAYDGGHTITADSGPVEIASTGGLLVSGTGAIRSTGGGSLETEGENLFKGPRPWVDPTHPDFGAQGNGTPAGGGADDTAALTAACAAVVSGATLYLPANKTFRVTGGLSINANFAAITGGGTILGDSLAPGSFLLTLGDDATAFEGTTLRGVTLQLIRAVGASLLRVRRNRHVLVLRSRLLSETGLTPGGQTAIQFERDSYLGTVEHCSIRGNWQTGVKLVTSAGLAPNGFTLAHNWLAKTEGIAAGTGFSQEATASNVVSRENFYEDWGQCIHITGAPGFKCRNDIFDGGLAAGRAPSLTSTQAFSPRHSGGVIYLAKGIARGGALSMAGAPGRAPGHGGARWTTQGSGARRSRFIRCEQSACSFSGMTFTGDYEEGLRLTADSDNCEVYGIVRDTAAVPATNLLIIDSTSAQHRIHLRDTLIDNAVTDNGTDTIYYGEKKIVSNFGITLGVRSPSMGTLFGTVHAETNLSGVTVPITMIPDGCLVVGMTVRILETITGPTSVDIGIPGSVKRYFDGLTTFSAGTTYDMSQMNTGGTGLTSPRLYMAPTDSLDIHITAVGGVGFTGGRVRVVLHTITLTPPQS